MSSKDYAIRIKTSLDTAGVKKGAAEQDRLLEDLARRELARSKKLHGDELRENQKFHREQGTSADRAGRDAARNYEKHLGTSFFSKLGRDATTAFARTFSSGGSGGLSGILSTAAGVAGGNFVTSILSGITSKISGAIKTGFDFNRLKEQSLLSFEIKLKGKDEAIKFFDRVTKWSVDAPLELDQSLEAVQKLMVAFTPDQALYALDAITDAVAGQGKVAGEAAEQINGIGLQLQQMLLKGKVSAEETTSLAERQIKVYKYLGDEIGKTDQAFAALTDEGRTAKVQEMAQKGLISAKTAVAVILKGMKEEYGGTAKRIAEETLAGIESNTADRVAQLAGKSSQAAFEAYKQGNKKLLDYLNSPVGDIGAATINNATGAITSRMESVLKAVTSGDFSRLGFDAIQSAAGGVTAAGGKLYDAGAGTAKSLEDGWRDQLDQHSPSKLLLKLGFDAGESLALGFQKGAGSIRFSDEIEKAIRDAAERTGLDPNLIRAVVKQESGGRRGAVSNKGARGAMQLMPATAARFGVTDIHDPRQNIMGGSEYLAWLMRRFGGDRKLALAGYNAGEGAVGKYHGIPPYKETQDYVRKIEATYQRLQELSGASGGSLQSSITKFTKSADQMSESGGSLQSSITKFTKSADQMSELAARMAASVGEDLRRSIDERAKEDAALSALRAQALAKWEWAKSLPEGNPGEVANKKTLVEGAWNDLTVAQNAHVEALASLDSRIAELRDTLRQLVTGGRAPSEAGFYEGAGQGRGALPSGGDLPIFKTDWERVMASMPPLTRELDSLRTSSLLAIGKIGDVGVVTGDVFEKLPPLINTAAAEAKESAKEFDAVAGDIAGIFGTGLATALTGNFKGALQGLKSDLFSFTTNWIKDLFTKSIFDAIKGNGSASSPASGGGGGGGILSSIWKGITGIFHRGATPTSSGSPGTPAFNPNAGSGINFTAPANLRGTAAYGATGLLTGGASASSRAIRDLVSHSTLSAPTSATTGSAASGTSTAVQAALSSSKLFQGIGFGLKPGSGGQLSAMLPFLGASLGGSLTSGLYPQGGRLASILGMGGGALLGIGLTAAPTALGTGVLAGLFSNPITAGIGAALLVGSLIYGRNRQRQADERKRDQISGSTGQQIWQLIGQAKAGTLGLSEAKKEWARIDAEFHQQIAQIRDSKARRNSEKQWTQDFMPLRALLLQAATQSDTMRAQSQLLHPTFSFGSFASGGAVFSDGGAMQPLSAALYLGDAPFRGRVPGRYDRKDNRIAKLTGDEVVLTPDVWRPIQPYLAARRVKGFESGGAVFTGAQVPGVAPVFDVTLNMDVTFGEETGVRLLNMAIKSSDGQKGIIRTVRSDIRSNPSNIPGDIELASKKQRGN